MDVEYVGCGMSWGAEKFFSKFYDENLSKIEGGIELDFRENKLKTYGDKKC